MLKVLQPLLSEGGPSRHTAQRIGQLRGQLETAVRDNKVSSLVPRHLTLEPLADAL